ncbi:MAG: beta-N-acetylhexosaminidase [Frankiaceae bacterium]|jgi:beta-N-acetylhexosaminidase|nr:beta-N-acetylhexosaminidase [Frankiaceae bacterium]
MSRSVRRSLACMLAVLCLPVFGGAARATTSTDSIAAAAYARMTTAQRIGQLFMVGEPATGATSTARSTLARYRVGNVILMGKSSAGTAAVAGVAAALRGSTTQAGVRPYVAVDQEGGYVQHLTGPGFSTIPTALRQGQFTTDQLRADWKIWATQLHRAGINLDLAPVADVVPASVGTANQPIGRYYREYGHTTSVVGPHVSAAAQGMAQAAVGAAAKHFPGLGRATGNTDTASGVTDPTTRHDAYLAAFRSAISAPTPFVMVSTAIYPNIAPHTIGAFSHLIVTTMLRYDLGFSGVIVSDSLQAKAVSAYSYASRAILSLDAGVDILLITTDAPLSAMVSAIAQRMTSHSDFASVVKTAVMRVLKAKAKAGLITG